MGLQTFILISLYSICISSAILSLSDPNIGLVAQNFPQNDATISNSDIQNDSKFSSLELNNSQNTNMSTVDSTENTNSNSSEFDTNIDENTNSSTVSTNSSQISVSINTSSQTAPELPSRIEQLNNQIENNSSIFVATQETANIPIIQNSTQQLSQPSIVNPSDNQVQFESTQAPILGEPSTNHNMEASISTDSLRGNFSAQFTNLPPINLTIESGRISFSGCNINSFPFQAFQNGSFLITGPGISTRRACLGQDNDGLYSAEIESVNGYSQNNGNIVLTKNGQISIVLAPSPSVNPVFTANSSTNIPSNQVITTTSAENANIPEITTTVFTNNSSPNTNQNSNIDNISGSYLMFISGVSVPSISAQITNNEIGFLGCNSISISYSISPNGNFQSIRPAIQTLKFCAINNDGFYIDAILNADTYAKDQTGIHLSRNGIRMISFFNSDSVNATRTTFEKPKKLTLRNSSLPEIDAFVSEQRIRLNGCNSIIINYESFSNGFFRLTGPIMITRNSCEVNNDQQYIQAIRSANMHEQNGDSIILLDGTDVLAEINGSCA